MVRIELMQKIEKIICGFAVIVIILKFSLIPEDTFVTLISLTLLTFFYYPFCATFSINKKNKFIKLSYVALSTCIVGILSSLLFWKSAINVLRLNTIFAFISFIILLIIRIKEQNEDVNKYYKTMIFRFIIILLIAVTLIIIPVKERIKLANPKDEMELIDLKTNYYLNPSDENFAKLNNYINEN